MYKIHSLAKNNSKGVIILSIRKKYKFKGTDKVKDLTANQFSKTDPNGSYTGVPSNTNEKPVQDADDL